MEVKLHRTFLKQYEKLPAKVKLQAKGRLGLFRVSPLDGSLNNHPLKGEWLGYRSINITGDFRAIYKLADETAVFVAIGTHSQLYR